MSDLGLASPADFWYLGMASRRQQQQHINIRRQSVSYLALAGRMPHHTQPSPPFDATLRFKTQMHTKIMICTVDRCEWWLFGCSCPYLLLPCEAKVEALHLIGERAVCAQIGSSNLVVVARSTVGASRWIDRPYLSASYVTAIVVVHLNTGVIVGMD